MAIKAGDKDLFPYLGDYRPVNIYNGEHKVAGWKWAEQSGEELYFENTYNDFVDVGVDGKSMQEGEPSPDNPVEIHSLNNFDVVSSVGGRNLLIGTSSDEVTSETEREYELASPLMVGWYMISFYAKSNNPTTVMVYINDNLGINRVRQGLRPNVALTSTMQKITVPIEITASDGISINNITLRIRSYGFDITDKETKLERGNIATGWTPAPEDTDHPLINKINLLLSEPLKSVGDVKDRLFRDSDGLWKVERNVSEATFGKNLKPTATHTIEDNPDIIAYHIGAVYSRMNLYDNTNLMVSNYFSYYPEPHSQNTTKAGVIARSAGSGGRSHNVYFFVEKEDFPDLQSFNIWLEEMETNGKPVKIVGEAKNVLTETLDQEIQDKLNNLRSFQDSNYVYTTGSIEPHLIGKVKVKDV